MVSLHDANGAYVAEALTDQDMSSATDREYVIDSDGKIYVWNYRYAQWRESAGVITLGAKAEESKPETKAADKDK